MDAVFTIGHSTRTIDEFVGLLRQHNITQLVDIRTIPKSRHNPQYEQAKLKRDLKDHGVEYYYLEKLGGLRPAIQNSTNDAWRNQSFRNYADYMQSRPFDQGLSELIQLSQNGKTAIMCAEAVPWRCHRSLVADALVVKDVPVCEIIAENNTREHKLTSFAVVEGAKVTYPKSTLEKSE